jgi:hypothetical protein
MEKGNTPAEALVEILDLAKYFEAKRVLRGVTDHARGLSASPDSFSTSGRANIFS